MNPATLTQRGVSLEDRYTKPAGAANVSGIQALVRVALDQRRIDAARGLRTAGFISGYQGSPLGGLDRELARSQEHLDAAGIVFRPGLNEELAATAVAGTQLIGELEGRRVDGVTGFWYGKNPGLDRAADAIRHGNLSGTAPLGGAVAWIGDDPSAKSSTVPSACEQLCRSLLVPLLAPGSIQEILELGMHAVAMSRHSGLWSALKIVADTADANATVDLGDPASAIPQMPPREAASPPILLPPTNLAAEDDLIGSRLQRVYEYSRAANLNRVVFEPSSPRIVLLAAGMAHQSLLRALSDLGLGPGEQEMLGFRIVRLAMPWPLEQHEVRRLVAGADTVLVVEDKLPFIESQVKEALYRSSHTPLVLGAEDEEGRPLLRCGGSLSADDVARALGRVIDDFRLPPVARERLAALRDAPELGPVADQPKRTPYFCSGCPHNTSTRAEPDELIGAGIGCHTMIAIDPGRRGKLVGMTQMGGEGAQWTGLAPFTEDKHFVQNLGDGTFFHSGSLAIRAAVAAGVDITYKLLFNDAVAMTGGQAPEGRLDVPAVTKLLELEGVRRIIVTTPEPERYRGVRLAGIAEVRDRDEIAEVQRELSEIPGVTVLLHDDRCANEKRRMRKRGKLASSKQRVWINERVCEGCGDCGEKSSCLSVLPVQTEFGRKTQIHQASCNEDFSCVKGDCPSFVLVEPRGEKARREAPAIPVALPDPNVTADGEALLRMPGVGGTGVVTASQIVQMAAHLDGRFAAGLEQTGLAQKGGPVISDVRISSRPISGQVRASGMAADAIIGFDLLGAAGAETLATADPARTVAVLNTGVMPTAQMVTDPRSPKASVRRAVRRIAKHTRPSEIVELDAGDLAERLFGDHMAANMLLIGAAFQKGCIPVSADAIERAIELNGAAVKQNLAAFGWGRALVADPVAAASALPALPGEQENEIDARATAMVAEIEAGARLREVTQRRASELIAYQDVRYAEGYVAEVLRVREREAAVTGSHDGPAACAYAEGLFKLMAYKDEYEVARLHLLSVEEARREAEFGPRPKVKILLQPPLLRALGLKRKLRLSGWALGALRALYAMRGLRGTWADPFGKTKVRRAERALIGEYRTLVSEALESLTPETKARATQIAELPDLVRGYEEIKLRGIEAFRAEARRLAQSDDAREIRLTAVTKT